MKLKDIAIAVLERHEELTCKLQSKKTQILVQSSSFPEETVCLLSPYYQGKIKNGTFEEEDLQAVLIESDRIFQKGL